MSRRTNSKKHLQLQVEEEQQSQLTLALAEAAQREAQLQMLLERRRKENVELKQSLDFQRVRLNGFQLELEARQYLLPFVMAQVDLLMQDEDVRFTPHVRGVMESIQTGLHEAIDEVKGQKPTLDPSSWLMLARRLGLGTDFKLRRIPARRPVPGGEET